MPQSICCFDYDPSTCVSVALAACKSMYPVEIEPMSEGYTHFLVLVHNDFVGLPQASIIDLFSGWCKILLIITWPQIMLPWWSSIYGSPPHAFCGPILVICVLTIRKTLNTYVRSSINIIAQASMHLYIKKSSNFIASLWKNWCIMGVWWNQSTWRKKKRSSSYIYLWGWIIIHDIIPQQ